MIEEKKNESEGAEIKNPNWDTSQMHSQLQGSVMKSDAIGSKEDLKLSDDEKTDLIKRF